MIDVNILNLFTHEKMVVIMPHINPDGDAIGSSIALKKALQVLGSSEVYIISNDEMPGNLRFLGANEIINTTDFNNLNTKPDIIITIDSSDIDRLEDRRHILNSTDNIVNIDHHITNNYYGKYNIVHKDAAATGEVIYDIIKQFNVDIDEIIATNLYVAISTDTGNFKYSNTSSKSHKIVAELLKKGISIEKINTELYQNRSMSKVKLLSDTLNTLEFHCANQLSIMYITQDMFNNNNLSINDADGIIEYGRDIENIKATVLLKELSSTEIKVGFRSKYDTDVSSIAQKFGGGGHKNASGCTINNNLNNAKQQIIDEFKKELR